MRGRGSGEFARCEKWLTQCDRDARGAARGTGFAGCTDFRYFAPLGLVFIARNAMKTVGESVFVWNVDHEVTARQRCVHRRNDPSKMELDVWPLLVSENYDGNLAPGKILLIADILIRRKEQLVAGFLGLTE